MTIKYDVKFHWYRCGDCGCEVNKPRLCHDCRLKREGMEIQRQRILAAIESGEITRKGPFTCFAGEQYIPIGMLEAFLDKQ